jgi:hypothetical protein
MSEQESPWLVLVDVAPEILRDVLAHQLERPDMKIVRGGTFEDGRCDVKITSAPTSASGANPVLELRLPATSRARRRRGRGEQIMELHVTDVAGVRRALEVLCPRRFAIKR